MSLAPTFQGEVQFRRWSDSSTQGVQITFALPDSSDLEPLKHKAGKRFMAVLVEIGDDEQAVQPAPKKDQRGPLCREACDYCGNAAFRLWVAEVGSDPVSMDDAREWILNVCGVLSRKELDAQPSAGERFIRMVRVPFMRWQRELSR
jgi:hypothetical protein